MGRAGRSVVAALPTAAGLAVHAAGGGRILPWTVARLLLDDPGLTVHTCAPGYLSPWDGERLLAALAAGEERAVALLAIPGGPQPHQVRDLPRHARAWAATVDVGVIAGDLDAACCRAGLPLPGDDPLRRAAAAAALMRRGRGQLEVRARLLADHPWIGDAAWMSATGQLAEVVVLHGLRRDQVRRPAAAAAMPVRGLLRDPGRFQARREDVRRAMAAILEGEVRWNERGHLSLRPAGGFHHRVGGQEVAIGVGGLHSTDAAGVVDGPLTDLDVASYYPSIIARDGLAPPQLPDFAARVADLLARRLAAKRRGDRTASQALKFVINSLYGQLGNHRSGLFSPPDALRVVLTGQLHLLELLDALLDAGCAPVSANTDGVMARGGVEAAAAAWEARTGLSLERTPYRRVWRTSVNDYVAQGDDGGVAKAKGRFAGGDDDLSSRKSSAAIVARAAVEHLVQGRPIAATVAAAEAVTDFTLWRHARGLRWDGQEVTGTVVRWVVGPAGRPIVQDTEDGRTATVAAHALPVADPGLIGLQEIDRAWYAAEALDLVDRVLGTRQGARQLSLFPPASA